jgi:hypothetical protein
MGSLEGGAVMAERHAAVDGMAPVGRHGPTWTRVARSKTVAISVA